MLTSTGTSDYALAATPWGQIYKIIALAGILVWVCVCMVCDSPQLNATDITDIVELRRRRQGVDVVT